MTPEPVQADKILCPQSPKKAHAPIAKQTPRRRLCYLSPKMFWIVLCGVLLVAMTVIIGGVVGGIKAGHSDSLHSKAATTTAPVRPSEVDVTVRTANPSTKSPDATQELGFSGRTVTVRTTENAATPATSATTAQTIRPEKEKQEVSTTYPISKEANPSQTLYRECPFSDNTVYRALKSDSHQFRRVCNASFRQNHDTVVAGRVESLNDCIDMCAAFNLDNKANIRAGRTRVCNSVCWRNSLQDTDFPGMCFGSTLKNISYMGFPIQEETRCDSAAWMNEHFLD